MLEKNTDQPENDYLSHHKAVRACSASCGHDHRSHDVGRHVGRRAFLGLTGATMATATGASLFTVSGFGGEAEAASLTREQRDALTPDRVIEAMLKGNERFATGERRSRDFLAEQQSSSAGQFPAAVVLGCLDSRTPVEVICDLGIGDAFAARVAGNVVNDDILGSMEFACAVAGAKLVVVMGHTACGAIKGAIDDVVLGNLTGLVSKIRPAIRDTVYEGERKASNDDFVDAVARANVALCVAQIRERSRILREMEEKGQIKIIGSMYDLKTARVTLL